MSENRKNLCWEGQNSNGWIVRVVENNVPGRHYTRQELREVSRLQQDGKVTIVVLQDAINADEFEMLAHHWDRWCRNVAGVTELHPVAPDGGIVAQLREMLAAAEKGELVGLAYVGAFRGRGTYSRGLYGEIGSQQLLLGLEVLKYKIVKEVVEAQ